MLITAQRTFVRPFIMFKRFLHNEYIITNEENGIREITLNHQKSKNSLSLDMMNHLIQAINNNKSDISLRVIVLSAKGNVFSAGHNLKELVSTQEINLIEIIVLEENNHAGLNKLENALKDIKEVIYNCKGVEKYYCVLSVHPQSNATIAQHKLIFSKATELMNSIVQSPVPVIAKVNGFATAAGCQLVATCDMIVCSDSSKFSTPGANFGIFCSTPGIAIGRSIPKSKATYMLFTGEPITAQEAYDSGLVTKVSTEKDLDNEVNKIIEKIKVKSRSVISLGKQFYYKQIELSLFEAYKLGEDIMVDNINIKDGQEGIMSFIEKRKAKWSHE